MDRGTPVHVSYEYDGLNHRISRTGTDGKKTEYAYGRNGAVIVERTGTSTRSYIYANGVIVGFVDSDGATSGTRYCITDHQGSVEKIVDDEGRVLWASCYTAFGIKGGETVNRIEFSGMYTGKDIDPETELTYHWNRWRSEDGSVWLSEDPARDGTNWYGYCGNNPVMFIDPNGLETAGYNNKQGSYDLLPKLQGIDTGNKWYNNLFDGFVSYGLEGTYNLAASFVNTISNGIGYSYELANKASEAVIGCDLDSAAMTLMANGMLAPAGVMLNGFNTYMNGLKLANTSKVATTALSTVQTTVNVGAGLFNIDPLPTSATKFYVAPNGDCLPAVGYRYMDSRFYDKTLESMSVPGSYFGFEKFDSANQAINAFQINPSAWKNNCQLRGEFDTLQVFDGCFVPKSFGNTGDFLEPYTCCYPMLGTGGYQQYMYTGTITLSDVKLLEK